MAPVESTARQFFEACEAGKGWEAFKAFCTDEASFSAQAEPLADLRTLQQYADWMKGLMQMMPDGRYEIRSLATDTERNVLTPTRSSAAHTPARADRRRPAGAHVPTTCIRWGSTVPRPGT